MHTFAYVALKHRWCCCIISEIYCHWCWGLTSGEKSIGARGFIFKLLIEFPGAFGTSVFFGETTQHVLNNKTDKGKHYFAVLNIDHTLKRAAIFIFYINLLYWVATLLEQGWGI